MFLILRGRGEDGAEFCLDGVLKTRPVTVVFAFGIDFS